MALTLDSLKPIFPKYDYKYTERPKAACSTYLSDRNPFNHLPLASENRKEEVPPPPSFPSDDDGQPTSKTSKDWKGKSRGLFFHHPQGNVNVICVKLSENCKSPVPVICRERTKTRCTQTRYRESSAQTRPYLPEIANDKENYENYELYQISKLLDSYKPPGEYEAKVVERARRRRQYEKTLKLLGKNKEKHQFVVEAMEWEDWVAREEYIQGCQMLRMEIVEKMFYNREKNLRKMSADRISYSAERIQAKRASQLRKINIEYDRGMRRLEAKKQKINRCYRKGNIVQEHIDAASDLNAPQMRFGVNPNRRHFVGFRKRFDDRIDELDEQRDNGGLSSLACPFSKLKTWAKPKERMKEVTQRFCSDGNLKKMYESLKGLRMKSEAPKKNPKCLRKKMKSVKPIEKTLKPDEFIEEQIPVAIIVQLLDEPVETNIEVEQEFLLKESKENTDQQNFDESPFKTEDEIASIVGEFEGTTLGKLLQFLGDELERLKLQKKFQAIHLLAKKERWWREAAEAGLRQKENKQREEQEELFAKAYETRHDTSSLFLESVLEREFNFTAESLSRQKITELAEGIPEIDQDELDLEMMLLQGKDKQAYDRMIIGDYVRNKVFAVAEECFAKIKVEKLQEAHVRAIEEELYASVEKALANEFQTPEAICIVGEIVDELIDSAVTYDFDIFTPSSSSESELNTQEEVNDIITKLLSLATQKTGEEGNFLDTTDLNTKLTAEKEAKALIRKLVRKTIPQERWKAEGERIVEQTLSDTFNEAIYEIECLKASEQVRADDRLKEVISEIYHRMAECWGKNIEEKPITIESSGSEISGILRSVPSNINIFENSPPDLADSIKSSENIDDDEVNQSIRKFEYVDSGKLEKYEPGELCRCRERFNLLDKDSEAAWKSSISLQTSEEENEFSVKAKTSSEENASHYTDLIESRVFSAPSAKAFYPDLPVVGVDEGGYRVNLMTSSYERVSACFERASIFQEKPRCSCIRSREEERRSSY